MNKFSKMMKRIFAISVVAILLVATALPAFAFDYDEAVKSVFIVEAAGGAHGSGFAVTEKYILTNAHVAKAVEDPNNVTIVSYQKGGENNRGTKYNAVVKNVAEDIDLAVLEVKRTTLTPLSFGEVDNIKEGDKVYAIGSPLSSEEFSFTLTSGIISSVNRENIMNSEDHTKYIQTDAQITNGNSGGPLFNEDGLVIGVNTSGIDKEDLNGSIRVDYVTAYLDEINLKDYTVGSAGMPMWVWIAIGGGVVVLAGVIVLIIVLAKKGKKKAAPAAVAATPDFVSPEMPPMQPQFGDMDDGMNTIPAYNMPPVMEPELGIYVMTGNMGGTQLKMMAGEKIFLGKDPKFANLVFDRSYAKVSRTHCSVAYDAQNDRYVIVDLSSNGTYFENGRRLVAKQSTYAAHGEVLKLADDGCKIRLI